MIICDFFLPYDRTFELYLLHNITWLFRTLFVAEHSVFKVPLIHLLHLVHESFKNNLLRLILDYQNIYFQDSRQPTHENSLGLKNIE